MPSYGLTDDGFIAPRGADLLSLMRSELETQLATLGLGAPTYERDIVFGCLVTAVSNVMDGLGEQLQALYDAFDPNNATGAAQDNLGILSGVRRLQATYSQATITIPGTSGTVVRAGFTVQGGGTDGKAKWATAETVTIASGTVDVTVVCTVTGPVVATAAQITTIVTPLTGVDSVTNASSSTPGRDREGNDAYRLRRQESVQAPGSRSLHALRAQLLALTEDDVAFLTAVVCVDNDDDDDATVQGILMEPHSIAVVIYPDTITNAQKRLVGEAIYNQLNPGTKTIGSDFSIGVTGGDGFTKTIRVGFASPLTVNVEITVVLADGFDISEVEEPLKAEVADYFLGLTVGQLVRHMDIVSLVSVLSAELGGAITEATVLLNGVAANVVPTLTEIAAIGTNVVTE